MSKYQDGLEMSMSPCYQHEATQAQISIHRATDFTDLTCVLHLPAQASLFFSSFPPTDVKETEVLWRNPAPSVWDVTVKPKVEVLQCSLQGMKQGERVQLKRVVQQTMPLVWVQLATRHSSQEDGYKPGDTVTLELRVGNNGESEVTHIFVSHMLRDYVSYVPNTITASKGEATLLFRLIRWHIAKLQPGEEAVLVFNMRMQEGNPKAYIALGATYTLQAFGNAYGPYEMKSIFLDKH